MSMTNGEKARAALQRRRRTAMRLKSAAAKAAAQGKTAATPKAARPAKKS